MSGVSGLAAIIARAAKAGLPEPSRHPRQLTAGLATLAPLLLAAAVPVGPGVPVPEALRGRWSADYGGIVEACDVTHADDWKWSMTALPEKFEFWEASATPAKVRRVSPNRYIIDLDFEGEGSSWKQRTTYTLFADGRTLTAVDADRKVTPAIPRRRYHLCPTA